MRNAYNVVSNAEAILMTARAMQLLIPPLPAFEPRYRIGVKQCGPIAAASWPDRGHAGASCHQPEKRARSKEHAPRSYYALKSEEPEDSYTVLIGEANAAMRVYDRMPVILQGRAAR